MNLSRFVDIKINDGKKIIRTIPNGETVSAIVEIAAANDSLMDGWSEVLRSGEEVLELHHGTGGQETYYFGEGSPTYSHSQAYFDYLGAGLVVTKVSAANLVDRVKQLPDDIVNVLVVASTTTGRVYGEVVRLAGALNSDVNQIQLGSKLIYYDMGVTEYSELADKGIGDDVPGLVVHIVPNRSVIHAARGMAYVSRQKGTGTDTVKEYLYTNLSPATPLASTNVGSGTWDSLVEVWEIDRGFNLYVRITEDLTTTIGGLTTSGEQIVERYLKIVLLYRLTKELTKYIIVNKPGFTPSTANEIYNILTLQLDRFFDSGWLIQGTATKDYRISSSIGDSYTLLSRGEVLINGYKVVILPYTSSDVSSRTFGNIHLFLSTLTGISKLVIIGEVI